MTFDELMGLVMTMSMLRLIEVWGFLVALSWSVAVPSPSAGSLFLFRLLEKDYMIQWFGQLDIFSLSYFGLCHCQWLVGMLPCPFLISKM